MTDDLAGTWAWINKRCAGSDQVLSDLFYAVLCLPQRWARVPDVARHHIVANLEDLATAAESLSAQLLANRRELQHELGVVRWQRLEEARPTLADIARNLRTYRHQREDLEALPHKRNARHAERTFTAISIAQSMHRMLGEAPPQLVADLCNAIRGTPGELDGNDVTKLLKTYPMPEQDDAYVEAIKDASTMPSD